MSSNIYVCDIASH